MVYRDERVRHILDNLPALVAILDRRLRYRYANRQHASWFGENPDVLVGVHLRDIIGPTALEMLRPCCEKTLGGETSNYTGDMPFRRGGEKFVHATCIELSAEAGEDISVLLMITDLSEQQNIQQALDASTLRSHTILNTAVDAILTIDEEGIIQSSNAATESLFGYRAGELVGQNVKVLMPANYAAEHDGYLRRYLDTGDKHIIGIGRDVLAKTRDGTEFPAHLAVGEFRERGRRYFTGFIRDVTVQKEAEQEARAHLDELSHLSRLSAIESLASGVMHEINQPLTAIVSMSQALLRMQNSGGAEPSVIEDVLERIVSQCVRVNAIVQQMREMARKSKSTDRSAWSVDEIIDDVKRMLEYELVQNDVALATRLNAGDVPVMANRIQIEQVLLNLMQNAIHAVSANKGDRLLLIESGPTQGGGPMVEVRVRDNGIGLPEPTSGDIFDPFFTTKKQGLGQGLSISRSIVETHGGKMGASNHPEGGAEFRFTLPAAISV